MALKPMLKTGYTNHVDAALHKNGELAYVIVNKVIPGADRKQSRDVHIFEVKVPENILLRKIKSYTERVDMPGPAGYCTVDILPNGFLLVNLAIARADNPLEIVWHTDVLSVDELGRPIAPPYSTTTGTEDIVAAIEYARSNPDQSRLRALIREVIAAGS